MNTAPLNTDRDALLSEAQAADFLNLSIRTLQTWRSTGRGPKIVRAGRAVRYRRCDLMSWAEAHTTEPKAVEAK